MRCFESHKVVALEDMRKDGTRITIHKPLECDSHPGENVIYNCTTCNVTACGECTKTEHKGHPCEGILDSETRVRQEMETLLAKSKERIEQLVKTSTGLNSNMEELAHQRSTARDLINESYQSYKAVLEKCRDSALEELNKLYHERELKIMKVIMTNCEPLDIHLLHVLYDFVIFNLIYYPSITVPITCYLLRCFLKDTLF